MIKLCACDMDGTLLNREGKITDFTAKAIKKFQEKGFHFVVITGRADEGVDLPFEGKEVVCKRILMNGAQIKDENKKVLFEKTIPFSQIKIFDEILKESGFVYSFYGENCRYTFFTVDQHRAIDEFLNQVKMPDKRYQNFIHIQSLADLKDKKIFKMEARSEHFDQVAPLREKLRDQLDLHVTSAVSFNVEATHQEANKATALKSLCRILNLEERETAIFGDGLNDLILFQSFEETYAVENACEEVKKIAKYHIQDHDQEAVAEVLIKLASSCD